MESFASIDSFLSKQESGSNVLGAISSGSGRNSVLETSIISQIKDRVRQRELTEGDAVSWHQDLLLSQQISDNAFISKEKLLQKDDSNDEPEVINAGIVHYNWDNLFISNVKMDNFLDPLERNDEHDSTFGDLSYLPSGMQPSEQIVQESTNNDLVIESLEDEMNQYTDMTQAQLYNVMENDDIETLQFSDDDEDNNYHHDLNQNLYEQEHESEQQELQFLLELVAQDRRRHQDFLNMMLSRFPVSHALNNFRIRNEEEEDDSRGDLESKATNNNNNGLEALEDLLNNLSSDEEDNHENEESNDSDLVQAFEAL